MVKIWKDKKTGKWLEPKEFAERFKSGVQGVSPLQQVKVSLYGQYIVLVGIIVGIIVNAYAHYWWLLIILVGSLFVALMSLLGQYQKYQALKNIDLIMNQSAQDLNLEMKGGIENKDEIKDKLDNRIPE